jgi:succinate dehydrogenase / fumarate reductase flavoprotein subunit
VRNDDACKHVTVWEYQGEGNTPLEHREPLTFEEVHLSTRSYR